MGALVVLPAQAGSIEPGAEAETVVLVRNTGDGTDTFHGRRACWPCSSCFSSSGARGHAELLEPTNAFMWR